MKGTTSENEEEAKERTVPNITDARKHGSRLTNVYHFSGSHFSPVRKRTSLWMIIWNFLSSYRKKNNIGARIEMTGIDRPSIDPLLYPPLLFPLTHHIYGGRAGYFDNLGNM